MAPPSDSSGWRVHRFAAVDDIPAEWLAAWDDHAPALAASPAWARLLESFDDFERWYLVVTSSGAFAGALVLGTLRPPPFHLHMSAFYRAPVVLDGENGWIGPEPKTLLAGGLAGYRGEPVLTDEDPTRAFGLLADAALDLADDLGFEMVAFLYATTAAAQLLRDRAPAWLVDAGASIPLPGDGFDDYLGQLPSKRRTAVRSERKAFTAAGGRVSQTTLTDSAARRQFADVLHAHHRRYGHQEDPSDVAAYIAAVAEHLRPNHVFEATAGGRLLGTSCVCVRKSTLVGRTGGMRDEHRDVPGAYFEVTYYSPIEAGYALGATDYDVGLGSLATKIARGAEITPRWAVFLPTGRADEDPRRRDRWNSAMGAQLAPFTPGRDVPASWSALF